MFEYGSGCAIRIPFDPHSPSTRVFDATGNVSLSSNDEGEIIACVWDVSDEVGWCENFDLLVCRLGSDGQSLVAVRRATEAEIERVGAFEKAQPATPQDMLMAAVCNNDVAAAIAAIDAAIGKGANFTDEGVQTLYWAASGGRPEVVKHLLARGATTSAEWTTNSQGEPGRPYGDTALHAAAEDGHVEILRMLLGADGKQFLEKYGLQSGWRATPLGIAAKRGHVEACRLLLAAGADVNAHDDFSIGETPLCEAVKEGHVEVVRLLLAAGADPAIPGWMSLTARERALRGEGGQEIRRLLGA